jgi:anti-sigma regulatory factor (Ser/Thr protein kinase)
VLADAAATHPVLIDATGQRDSGTYAPDRIVATYNRPLPEPGEPAPAMEVTVATPTGVTAVRRLVGDHAAGVGLPADRVVDVELVVTELVTNSVEHGGGAGTVRLWTSNDHLVCEVRDHGTLGDPLAGRRPARPDDPRGRGLLLVNQIADLVRVYAGSESTAIRAHFLT